MARRLLVLGWHNVVPTPGFPDAGRAGFARQLRFLARWTTVLPLARALDLAFTGRPLPPRAVALTFDDGYRDHLDVAVPMLARHHLPATFFLVPGFLSGTASAWWEDLAAPFAAAGPGALTWRGERFAWRDPTERDGVQARIRADLRTLGHTPRVEAVAEIAALLAPAADRPPARDLFLDWDGAAALLAAGHEIGSHTVRHAILGREDPETQFVELADSRAALVDRLGAPVDTLAYPNGDAGGYGAVTTALAERAGYRAALTARAGFAVSGTPPFEMRRVVVTPTTDLGDVVSRVARRARRLVRP